MRKLGVILLVLALPTLVVTFWWLVTGGWFNWIDGLRCAGALLGNFIALFVAFLIIIGAEDSELKEWTDGWKMRA